MCIVRQSAAIPCIYIHIIYYHINYEMLRKEFMIIIYIYTLKNKNIFSYQFYNIDFILTT